MRWSTWLRTLLLILIGVVFFICLAAILLTGPIIVRVTHTTMDVEGLGVSSERLRHDVETLCAELSPRSERHRERLDRAAEWIHSELAATGLFTEFQDDEVGAKRFRNVIATRPGSDPAAGVIVIGAHYDAYGETRGADDNASGVAVLLELVRTLPVDYPRRGHLFVAFSTEEPPHFRSESMGSHAFARRLADSGVPVLMMISLDMVGYYSDEKNSQSFPFPGLGRLYPTTGDFAAVIGDTGSGRTIARVKRGMQSVDTIPVRSFRAPAAWAPVDLSDHWSFRRLGFQAVQISDTAFMRFPHYHTAEDTPEKLDYERMARLVEALHGLLWEDRPPPERR